MKRREFISSVCAGISTGVVLPKEVFSHRTPGDRELRLLEAARKSGAEYAVVRKVVKDFESLQAQNDSITSHVSYHDAGYHLIVSTGKGIGCYGLTESSDLDEDTAAGIALSMARANEAFPFRTIPLTSDLAAGSHKAIQNGEDPIETGWDNKKSLLLKINELARGHEKVEFVVSNLFLQRETVRIINSNGLDFIDTRWMVYPNFAVSAIDRKKTKRIMSRRSDTSPVRADFGFVQALDLSKMVNRAVRDLENLLDSDAPDTDRYDLVLAGEHLWRVVDETLGYHLSPQALYLLSEFSPQSIFQISSFKAGPSALSKEVTLRSEPGLDHSLAHGSIDDLGRNIKPHVFIENGEITAFPKPGAHAFPETPVFPFRADGWRNAPIPTLSNLVLQPGPEENTIERMVSGINKGILIHGSTGMRHHHDRSSVEVWGEIGYLIEHGKITKPLRGFSYIQRVTDFWASCISVGNAETSHAGGSLHKTVGDDAQTLPVTVQCPAALFINVPVRNLERQS